MLWQESGRKPCRISCRRSCHDANLRQFQQTCVYLLQKIVSDLQYSAVACSHLCRFAADFLLGLAGNQPLFTRFSCSKSSKMDQKEEKAATPEMVDHTMLSMKRESAAKPMPARRKSHQQPFPRWYSALMTRGWHTPMIRNVQSPMMIPEKFI